MDVEFLPNTHTHTCLHTHAHPHTDMQNSGKTVETHRESCTCARNCPTLDREPSRERHRLRGRCRPQQWRERVP